MDGDLVTDKPDVTRTCCRDLLSLFVLVLLLHPIIFIMLLLPAPVCNPCCPTPALCWSEAAASHGWSASLLKQISIMMSNRLKKWLDIRFRDKEGLVPAEAADSDGTGSQARYGWCVWTLSLFDTRAWISRSTSPLITASFLPNLNVRTTELNKQVTEKAGELSANQNTFWRNSSSCHQEDMTFCPGWKPIALPSPSVFRLTINFIKLVF